MVKWEKTMIKNARYTLYYSPFACSLAVHAALEKIGEGFELEKIDVKKDGIKRNVVFNLIATEKCRYCKMGRSSLTRGGNFCIFQNQHPEAELMPAAATAGEIGKALSELFYMSNTVHPAFRWYFNDRFTTGDKTQVFDKTLSRLDVLLEEIDSKLTQQDFLNGNKNRTSRIITWWRC